MFHLTSMTDLEIDDADQCYDDIIGQSLMLAHNAVQSSPEQPLTSHIHCHGPLPVCDAVDDVCIRSCDQRGSCDQHRSHDQPMNSSEVIRLDSKDVANTTCSSSTHKVAKPPPAAAVATVTTNMPTKMSFIDWTEIKRKNVTPSDYPSTPTPIYVTVNQDCRSPVMSSRNPVMSSKNKQKTNTNPTVSFHKYLLFTVRLHNIKSVMNSCCKLTSKFDPCVTKNYCIAGRFDRGKFGKFSEPLVIHQS